MTARSVANQVRRDRVHSEFRSQHAQPALEVDLTTLTLEALHADFQQHGVAAIAAAREESPLGYVRMVASLLPQKVELNRSVEQMRDDELLAIIRGGKSGRIEERRGYGQLH